jgi:hypothetical protein
MTEGKDFLMMLALSDLKPARRDLLRIVRLSKLRVRNKQRAFTALDVDREAYRRILATRLAAARRASTRSRRGALP